MENPQPSESDNPLDNSNTNSGALHKFIAIGPQTEDILRESDLLGKNSEVVYSVDNVNQWDIESTPLEADLSRFVDLEKEFVSKNDKIKKNNNKNG